MKHKVEVKLRNGAIGAAPDVGVFFRFFNDPESIEEVVEFLACHGFPVGFKDLDGIKFVTTHHGDMQKIPFNNYVSITHAPDYSPHIIYFNTETFLKLYAIDKRHTVLKLQNLLDYHPCAKRCNAEDYSFFLKYGSLPSLEILRIYASEFGKAFRMTHDGYVVLTDSNGSISIAEGQTVRVAADGVLSVVEEGALPKFLSYEMKRIRERFREGEGLTLTNSLAIAYDGTARCRFSILEQIHSKRMQSKFLTHNLELLLNVMGNQTPVNVGDYIVAHDIGTDYSKVEVVTASDYQATYIEANEEDIMADNEKKKKKEKKGGKTLHNSSVSGARDNVRDIQVYGDGDTFKLICKASSAAEDWMKSTKAMEIEGVGCLVQVTTQQGDNVAEALTFVPNVRLELINGDKKNGRRLVADTDDALLEMLGTKKSDPVQDSLPIEGLDQFIAAQSSAHLFRGVFNVRRRAAYHDMARFDGTAEGADQVIEWVNNSSDICRVVYNNGGTSHPIVMEWDGEYPATPINVGDLIVHVGNGHFHVMSEKVAAAEYDLNFDGNTDPVVKEVAETAQGSAYAPLHLVDKDGNTAVAYRYDGSPACAGVIVNAARHTRCGAVCYQRGGLVVTYPTINKDDYIVAPQHYVVIKGEYAYAGDQTWLSSKYSPVLS